LGIPDISMDCRRVRSKSCLFMYDKMNGVPQKFWASFELRYNTLDFFGHQSVPIHDCAFRWPHDGIAPVSGMARSVE
jgi:hypothetical protein